MAENHDGKSARQLCWEVDQVIRFWRHVPQHRDALQRIQSIHDKFDTYIYYYKFWETPWSRAKRKRERKRIRRALRLPIVHYHCSGLFWAILCKYHRMTW